MTPVRAKRNSRAPERFTSDETKVDTLNNHASHRQGEKSDSAKKSNSLLVREPLKVKLPKLKRPQIIPPQIKVKISRVNGSNRKVGNSSPVAKIKVSLQRPKSSQKVVSKVNGPLNISNDGGQSEANLKETHETGDLKVSKPASANSDRTFSPATCSVDTKPDNMDESSVSSSSDHGDDPDSSFSSRNPGSSAMQIISERKTESGNSGIRCPCGVEDDIGVMVECEKCSTWQHGHCINVCSEEDAPEGYVCGYCLLPPGKHTDSLQQLTVGDKFQSKFDNLEQLMRKRGEKVTSQSETADENRVNFSLDELELVVRDLKRVFNSLKVKWKLLNNDDYSAELKIWRNPIWSDDPAENLREKQRQAVSFVGDVYKSNLRSHLSNLLSNMQKRCQLSRYQILRIHEPDSNLDNLLMVLDEISRVVEGYSEVIRQN